jgi:hypothetical protein
MGSGRRCQEGLAKGRPKPKRWRTATLTPSVARAAPITSAAEGSAHHQLSAEFTSSAASVSRATRSLRHPSHGKTARESSDCLRLQRTRAGFSSIWDGFARPSDGAAAGDETAVGGPGICSSVRGLSDRSLRLGASGRSAVAPRSESFAGSIPAASTRPSSTHPERARLPLLPSGYSCRRAAKSPPRLCPSPPRGPAAR